MSYCETACVLPACSDEAVPGLPAYTWPACPFGLNGEPFASAALPGLEPAFELPQVVPGAPGCPGPLGDGAAKTAAAEGSSMQAAIARGVMTRFISTLPFKNHEPERARETGELRPLTRAASAADHLSNVAKGSQHHQPQLSPTPRNRRRPHTRIHRSPNIRGR
jgi:hypothetical protein